MLLNFRLLCPHLKLWSIYLGLWKHKDMMLLCYRRVDYYYKQSSIWIEDMATAETSMVTPHIQFAPDCTAISRSSPYTWAVKWVQSVFALNGDLEQSPGYGLLLILKRTQRFFFNQWQSTMLLLLSWQTVMHGFMGTTLLNTFNCIHQLLQSAWVTCSDVTCIYCFIAIASFPNGFSHFVFLYWVSKHHIHIPVEFIVYVEMKVKSWLTPLDKPLKW